MIRLTGLGFHYPALSGEKLKALDEVTCHIDSGELVAIAGAAGSGKTTLIQHLNGLLTPSSGQVFIAGEPLETEAELSAARLKVGLVFQFPEAQFFEETVGAEVAFGPKNRNWHAEQIDTAVRSSLAQVGFDMDTIGGRSPFQLSGGEKRRVAIASTLAMNTEVLVLDEPTVGLDRRSASAIEKILADVHAQGRTVILVTHDMDLIARLALRVLVLNRGRLIFDGTPRALFEDEDLLAEAGLEQPSVIQHLHRLKAAGYEVPGHCMTLGELEAAMKTKDIA